MDILKHIPKGRENAITRSRLVIITGADDRSIREEIEAARRSGAIIINRQDGRGYYRSDDLDDIARQYEQNQRRALSILAQQKHLRRRLKAAGMLEGEKVVRHDTV